LTSLGPALAVDETHYAVEDSSGRCREMHAVASRASKSTQESRPSARCSHHPHGCTARIHLVLTTSSMVIMRTMLGSVAKQRAELRLMGQGAGRIGLCILGICGPNASLASKPVWKFPCTVVRVRRMAQCSFARSRALHTSHACCMQVYAVHDMPIRVGRCCTLLHNAVIVCTPRVLDAGTSVVSFPRQAAEAPARGSHRSRHAASWGPDLKPRHGLRLLSSVGETS
jgi:hypothetical protein